MSEDILLRSVGWAVHRIGKRTLILLALLLSGMGGVVMGLTGVLRGIDLGLLITVSLFSLFFGWWLARTRQPGWAAAAASSAAAVIIIFGRVGHIGAPFFNILRVWLGIVLQGSPWRTADWAPFLIAYKEFWTPYLALTERLVSWSSSTLSGEVTLDPVAVMLAWSFMLWAVAGWAGWSIRRWGAVLLGMAPAGALLAVTLSFTGGSIYPLLLFLTALLLLMFGANMDRRERRWELNRIDYPEDIYFEVSVVALALTLVLVSAASLAPSLSVRKMADLVQRLTREQNSQVRQIGESLGLERRPQPMRPLDRWYSPGLPRSHLLGAGPELSQQLIMRIRTGDLPPGPPDVILSQPIPRYYWRGLTYDRYTGRGWVTSQINVIEYRADQEASGVIFPAHQVVQQQVQFAGEEVGDRVLYAAGTLLAANQDFRAEWRRVPAGTNAEDHLVMEAQAGSDLFGATTQVNAYQARSMVAKVSADQLRSAGQDYPSWILQRYLALPETIPLRVFSLARDLTATQPTPYERARAIETHLRSYLYTLDLPDPPADRDVVDYFLFDLERGYCDYYATAMVVLARAAGLPARLVMGYAAGQYDALSASYIVTEANAHSWPEIYFPGYGWVEFEPTAGQPALERPGAAVSADVPELEPGEETSALAEAPLRTGQYRLAWLKWAAGLLGLVGIALLALSLADILRLRFEPPPAAVSHLYRRLYRLGRQLDVPSQRGDTPYEFTASLADRIAVLARGKRWENVLSPASRELHQLSDVYSKSLYSPTPPGKSDQARAIQTWERLRWRLWLARLIK